MISFEQLLDIIENSEPKSFKYRIADLLIQAINDWPTPANTIDEYANQIIQYFDIAIINQQNLLNALKKLKPEKDAWIMESLSDLIEVFKLTEIQEIKEIEKFLI